MVGVTRITIEETVLCWQYLVSNVIVVYRNQFTQNTTCPNEPFSLLRSFYHRILSTNVVSLAIKQL